MAANRITASSDTLDIDCGPPSQEEFDQLVQALASRDAEIETLRRQRDFYKIAYKSLGARCTDSARIDREDSGEEASDGVLCCVVEQPVTRRRKLDSSKPPWKNEPRPCNEFYLMDGCRYANCAYSHEYDMSTREKDILRAGVKKLPCADVVSGRECDWGDNCVYGHVCPRGPKCFYLKKGQCLFGGRNLHKVQRNLE
ncbi:hypothetical protein BD626DRAFT_481142 [Schizophyllum amplum]|uniref:C3H1-type domain-containing protein n=1 Tax=Schizophyllum amplum TaxID=97359 RepID=A0A550CTW5_9AGAR|nr:hypothetical protein BD626DRAFT_481142 [Auriculariopsis ampla]